MSTSPQPPTWKLPPPAQCLTHLMTLTAGQLFLSVWTPLKFFLLHIYFLFHYSPLSTYKELNISLVSTASLPEHMRMTQWPLSVTWFNPTQCPLSVTWFNPIECSEISLLYYLFLWITPLNCGVNLSVFPNASLSFKGKMGVIYIIRYFQHIHKQPYTV